MSKITVPLLLVSIDRGEEVISTKVPEHEIPILKVVHGEDSISVAEEDTGEEIELDEGADSEFKRLQRKYRRINAPDLVTRAFPTGASALSHAGFKKGGDKNSGPAQSASRVRPPAKKTDAKADKAKADAEKAKSEQKAKDEAEKEKSDLHAKLDALNVQYDKRSGVEKLREALAEAEKAAN